MSRLRRILVLPALAMLCSALSVVTASPASQPAQTEAQTWSWARAYGGRYSDVAWTVQQSLDGGVIAGGYTWSFGAGDCDFWLLKLAPDGTIEWQKTYGGVAEDYADLVYPTSDGGYLLIGNTNTYGAGRTDLWLLKLRADGSVIWEKAYGGREWDDGVAIQETQDGGYIVAGDTSSFGAGSMDVWVLKLRSDGSIEWQRAYGGPGQDTSSADPIHQTTDGGYIICGRTQSFGAGDDDVWVFKLDAQGAIQWQRTYGGRGHDESHAIRQTSDGGFAVAAFTDSFGAGDYDVWVLKLDSVGGVDWQKAIGGENRETCWSVYHTTDGGCVVCGDTRSFGAGSDDLWALKFAPDGALQWQKTYGGTARDWGESIRQASDGGYIAAGATQSFGAGQNDLWVLRLDASGSIPGCSLGVSSSAIPLDTDVVGVPSAGRVNDTDCRVSDTSASVRTSTASTSVQCAYGPTPSPTQTPSPTATRTATATRTPTVTHTPRWRRYLPLIRR
jgi:hypothetical protein